MAGENSPEARVKADAYAKRQAEQVRIQSLNAKINTPIIKVNTKKQAKAKSQQNGNRTDANGNSGFGAGGSTSTSSGLLGAADYDPNSALNKSWNTPNGGIQNPKFIYPGGDNRDAANKKTEKIKRGYIRRLTEFYDKENKQIIGSGKSTASTIKNMKCNFQFNPDNITRMVTAESDMQFFFNQDPSQLAQPIPGKAGFSFELLFNREAEVASQRYWLGDKLAKATFKEPIDNTVDYLDPTKPYDPSWVVHLGVLADILILDDVIGQGLAKDIYNAIKAGQTDSKGQEWGFSVDSPNSPTTATTTTTGTTTTTSKTIDQGRYDAYSMNLGNKAFLTPTPVRILFTKWMMVEGFVQSIQVTFNKFSAEMIPTQATVMIQMQALYIGFAQQNTFLTELPNIDVGNKNTVPITTPGTNSAGFALYEEYDLELRKKDFFDKTFSINHRVRYPKPNIDPDAPADPAIPFEDLFKLSSTTVGFAIDEATYIGANGEDMINKWKSQGKNYTIYWDGVLKVYWDSYLVKADGSAIPRRSYVADVNDSYTGATKYVTGVPPKQNPGTDSETDFTQYGVATKPWIFKTQGNEAEPKIYFGLGRDFIHTNINGADPNVYPGFAAEVTEWEFDLDGRDKLITNELFKPFKEDKFTVELGIRWRLVDDTYPDQSVFFYDWHYKKQTFEVGNPAPVTKGLFAGQKEWFYAWRSGDYRQQTGSGAPVSGTGVQFFSKAGL